MGLKGDKRGKQTQERRGRGERRGGLSLERLSARGKLCLYSLVAFITHRFICTVQAQGLDEEHALRRNLGVRSPKHDSLASPSHHPHMMSHIAPRVALASPLASSSRASPLALPPALLL